MHRLSFAPPEVRGDTPRAVITGRDEVLIERHRGLFSYETKCIRIRTKAGLMTITGEKLVIAYFGLEDLLIQGSIESVRIDGEVQ